MVVLLGFFTVLDFEVSLEMQLSCIKQNNSAGNKDNFTSQQCRSTVPFGLKIRGGAFIVSPCIAIGRGIPFYDHKI